MAQKRMISRKVWGMNRFRKLPDAARLLYVELCLRCDDDGFCDSYDEAVERVRGGEEALDELIRAGFLLEFEEVVVVRHWRVHNSLRADRLQELGFASVAKLLWITAEGVYETEEAEDRMNLLEYRKCFAKNKCDPLRQMREKSLGIDENSCDSQKRREKKKKEEKRKEEMRREELCAAAGLTDVQRQTLEVIMLPDGLAEGLRQVGADGDVYGKLLAWWKERIGDGDL